MVKNKVALGIALQFVSNIKKISAGDWKVLKHEGGYFQGLLFVLYLSRVLRNRYSRMTEVILCNVSIVTYHVDAPLQKHLELSCNKVLVFVPLFLDELL